MKLTNYIRDAFITSAMADVPKGRDHEEEIRKIVQTDLIAQLPTIIQKAWRDGNTIQYIKRRSDEYGGVQVAYPAETERYNSPARKLTAEAQKTVDRLAAEMKADSELRHGLRQKLKGAAYACNTSKQLRELLPEFGQYLPAEEETTCRTLPAVANIVADFARAGWPKDKKKAAA
jgi:hypothetical protein